MDRLCSLQKVAESGLAAVYALGTPKDEDYACAAREGRLYALRVNGRSEIVGAVICAPFDARFAGFSPAMCLRGIVMAQGVCGGYDAMISACELIGKARGLRTLRIACAAEDTALDDWCAKRGFARAFSTPQASGWERAIEQGCSCGAHAP